MIVNKLKLFFSYAKVLIGAKWEFKKIKKKIFLVIDGEYNPFPRYYSKKNFNILYRRGEQINGRVLLKCISDFNISAINYYRNFIKFAEPKLILTAFDYHPIFYRLSKISGVKTLMLQKGKRTYSDGIMNDTILMKDAKKKDFYVDYIFLYNKFTSDFYKKIIKGKYFNIGSFENNFNKIRFSSQKKEILFISNFKSDENKKLLKNCENDDLVIYNLHKLALAKKIKFNILPKQLIGAKRQEEFSFFKNLLKKNFVFINKKVKTSPYKIANKFKYNFCTYSTLGVENLSKGGRTGFIFFKSKDNPTRYFRFGSLEKLPQQGYFWTTKEKFDLNELKRVFNFVIKSNEKTWKSKSKSVAKEILEFDYNNRIFRSIVNKELNYKVN